MALHINISLHIRVDWARRHIDNQFLVELLVNPLHRFAIVNIAVLSEILHRHKLKYANWIILSFLLYINKETKKQGNEKSAEIINHTQAFNI